MLPICRIRTGSNKNTTGREVGCYCHGTRRVTTASSSASEPDEISRRKMRRRAGFSAVFSFPSPSLFTTVCIEANPAYWSRLAHRRCHVVAAAVGKDTNEEIDFRIGADGALGGIEHHDFDNKPQLGGGNKLSAKKMYTVTLRQVLERVGAPSVMDYMSLDVEGMSRSSRT